MRSHAVGDGSTSMAVFKPPGKWMGRRCQAVAGGRAPAFFAGIRHDGLRGKHDAKASLAQVFRGRADDRRCRGTRCSGTRWDRGRRHWCRPFGLIDIDPESAGVAGIPAFLQPYLLIVVAGLRPERESPSLMCTMNMRFLFDVSGVSLQYGIRFQMSMPQTICTHRTCADSVLTAEHKLMPEFTVNIFRAQDLNVVVCHRLGSFY